MQFGQGVNPQLGAINYNSYLQGSLQGSSALGKGIAGLGEGIGQGIEKYAEIAKQNKEKEATIKSTIKFLETFQDLPNVSPELKKVTLDALGSLHDPRASRDDLFALSQNAGKQLNMVLGMGQQAITNQLEERKVKADEIRAQAAMKQAERERAGENPSDKDMLFNSKVNAFTAENQRQPNPQEIAAMAKEAYAPSRMYASPEEQARTEELKAESNSAVKYLDGVTQQASTVSATEATNSEARRLLESSDTETGAGQSWLNEGWALAGRMGIADPTKLGNQQAMTAYLSTDALNQAVNLINGQGQVSDSERKIINTTAMDVNKSKEANLRVLDLRDAIKDRALGAENERQKLFDAGKSSKDIAEGVKRWYSKNSVTGFLQKTDFYNRTKASVNPYDPTGSVAREIAKRQAGNH